MESGRRGECLSDKRSWSHQLAIKLSRLLFAAYFLEAGLILIVAPWSALWEHNAYAQTRPALQGFLQSPYLRGAVSGVGGVTAIAGLVELALVVAARRREPPRQEEVKP